MNQRKAKEIRESVLFDTKAERTYTRDPRTGVIYANVERQRYRKLKKDYIRNVK